MSINNCLTIAMYINDDDELDGTFFIHLGHSLLEGTGFENGGLLTFADEDVILDEFLDKLEIIEDWINDSLVKIATCKITLELFFKAKPYLD